MYTLGKQTSQYDGKTEGEQFLFTLNVTSDMNDTLTIQLFNVIKSVIFDGTTQNGVTYKPFTINDTELIVAGISNVGIQTDGSLNYKDYPNALNVNIKSPAGQNLTYRDIFSMIQSGKYLKMSRISITSNLTEQLTQGTMNVININNLGTLSRKSVPLITFFDATQNQSNIIDLYINTHLCYSQGLEFTILPNSTATFQFYLEA